jgi:hypothetical protein
MEKTIAPCLLIFIPFGIQYFTFPISTPKVKRWKISWKFIILFIVIILALLAEYSKKVLFDSSKNNPNNDEKLKSGSQFFNGFFTMSNLITSLIIVVISFATTKSQIKLFEIYQEVNYSFLYSLGINLNLEKLRKKFLFKAIIIIIVYLVLVNSAIYIDWCAKGYLHKILLKKYYLLMAAAGNAIKFLFFIDLITIQLNEMKNELFIQSCNKIFTNNLTALYLESLWKTPKRLIALKKCYRKIYKMANILNRCFGWIIAVILILILTSIILSIFDVLRTMKLELSFGIALGEIFINIHFQNT